MSESVPAVRGGESALGWSYGAPFGCAAARASSALMASGVLRMSTTTISLPRPFILTKGRLASALMISGAEPEKPPRLYGKCPNDGQGRLAADRFRPVSRPGGVVQSRRAILR